MATRTNLPQAHAMGVTKEEGDGHFSSEQASPLLFGVHAVATSRSLLGHCLTLNHLQEAAIAVAGEPDLIFLPQISEETIPCGVDSTVLGQGGNGGRMAHLSWGCGMERIVSHSLGFQK